MFSVDGAGADGGAEAAASAGLLAEGLLGHGHRGHGLGPARVEGEVRQGLDELFLGVTVLDGQAEVVDELVGVAAVGQAADRDPGCASGESRGPLQT